MWDNLDLFIPGQSDKLNLQGFNDYLNNAIRQVDNETIIFFEVRHARSSLRSLCVPVLDSCGVDGVELDGVERHSPPRVATSWTRSPLATRTARVARVTTTAQCSATMCVWCRLRLAVWATCGDTFASGANRYDARVCCRSTVLC